MGVTIQPTLFPRDPLAEVPRHPDARPDTSTLLPLAEYDRILVQFSGGKDSAALTLDLLDRLDAEGVPRSRVELWHQCVDGEPGSPTFMDWPVTHAYCVAFARALDLPIRFQWREGGFWRELMRDGTPTAPAVIELADGTRAERGGKGEPGTRLRFPQQSGDLSVRWCSAYLKIDVAARAIAADPRLAEGRFLVLTGERREEGGEHGARAKYATTERHRTSNQRRRVDHHRPILGWSEARVWETLRAHGVVPHPVYYAGYGRCSCARCIFGGPDEWATARVLDPFNFERVAALEQHFGVTIRRGQTVVEQAARGGLLAPEAELSRWADVLSATVYWGPIFVDPSAWVLPAGAYRRTAGPT